MKHVFRLAGLAFLLLLVAMGAAEAQQNPTRHYSFFDNGDGTDSPYGIAKLTGPDPCTYAAKTSAAINVSSATTTSLVAVSGTTSVYVCGFAMTVAPSATSAATAAFEYGTGAACTSPTLLTGTFGNGDLTSAAPVVPVVYGGGSATVFKGAASNGVCILTAGTAVSVQGVLTYVQQ